MIKFVVPRVALFVMREKPQVLSATGATLIKLMMARRYLSDRSPA
jgi:hypothetical protein